VITNEIFFHTERSHFPAEDVARILPYSVATPMYAQKLSEHSLDVKDITDPDDFKKVPFTYKSDIHSTSVFERTPLNQQEIYAIYSSNGTSGKPTLYAWSQEDVEVQREISRKILTEIGVTEQDLGLVLAPLSLPVMGHCMIRQYESVGAGFVPLGPAAPESIISFIRDLPITSIATLPILASRLWEYMHYKMGMDRDESIQVRNFLCGGDFLSSARRARIEQDWNASCFDLYGISELFGPVAGECREKSGLHFYADQVFIEVLDPITKEPVHEGQKGVAVLTSLWRKGFPLLRYWTDDFVSLSSEPCACGSNMPRMWYHGRKIDCARLNGNYLFPKDVEDCLLRYPVSNEYYFVYKHEKKESVQAHFEQIPGIDLPRAELKESLSELFQIPVRLYVHTPGTLPRNQIKPKRLIGFPV
jgi:phenylacetate-CoA ligase